MTEENASPDYVVAVIGNKFFVLRRRTDIADMYRKRGMTEFFLEQAECGVSAYNAIDICSAMNMAAQMGEFDDRQQTELADILDRSIAALRTVGLPPEDDGDQ